ncbi:MAG: hypothetical protein II890_08265, partial [Spirochaetia bacterium]|nr:hypothetical protein [Spirochaetia bacterium]
YTYAGGTTPTGGGVGIKYMIGLDVFNGIQWCTTDAKGYSVTISEITRKEGGSQSGYYNTYNIIKEGGAESCTVDDYSSNLYPAFGCAIDYSVTGYTSGWYLPSYNEITPLINNKSKINDSMTKLVNAGVNAANFSGYVIWTSSIQAASACCYAIDVNYTGIVVPKDSERSVRVIHALDD